MKKVIVDVDDPPTPRLKSGVQRLLLDQTTPPSTRDTMVTCPADCQDGRITEETGSTYVSTKCETCGGTGLVTKAQSKEWILQRRGEGKG